MSDIRVVPFEADRHSVEAVTKLLNSAYGAWQRYGLSFTAATQNADTTRRRMRGALTWVAMDGERIAGVISYYERRRYPTEPDWYQRESVAHFGQFAVDPELQGFGIGAMLMMAVEMQAIADLKAELACDTAATAKQLIDFYTRRGFRPVGRHKWRCANYESVVLSKRLLIPRGVESSASNGVCEDTSHAKSSVHSEHPKNSLRTSLLKLQHSANPASIEIWRDLIQRLPGLVNVVFGVVLSLSVVTAKDLVFAFHVAPGLGGYLEVSGMLLLRIYLGIILWILYSRVLASVRRTMDVSSEWCLVAMTVPLLFFVASGVGFSGVPLIGMRSDLIRYESDYERLSIFSNAMLFAALSSLGGCGALLDNVALLSKAWRAEIRANVVYAFLLSLAALVSAFGSLFVLWQTTSGFPATTGQWVILALWILSIVPIIFAIMMSGRVRSGYNAAMQNHIQPVAVSWRVFALAVGVGAALTAAIYAAGTDRDSIATVALGFLAVLLAGAQIYIMGRQMVLMTRQDELLARRASLTVYGHVNMLEDDLDQLEADMAVPQGSLAISSLHIYITNKGTRSTSGFNLSVRLDAGPFLREPGSWQWYSMGPQIIYTYRSTRPLFPGDVEVIDPLDIVRNESQPALDIQTSSVRIAYEDDASEWLLLEQSSALPREFRVRLGLEP